MASTHGKHEGKGIVLYDGCPRCDEHAADPFRDLDDRHLLILFDMPEVMEGEPSDNDVIASRAIKRVLRDAQRMENIRYNRPWIEENHKETT